jgi:hypothetical protein
MNKINSFINISTGISLIIIGFTLKYNIEKTTKNIITELEKCENKFDNKMNHSFDNIDNILISHEKNIDSILDK